jgi:katanin p60 ATPase-containing subunit A1
VQGAAAHAGIGAAELNELAATIRRDIFLDNPNVAWDSVAGMEDAKKLLKEAVVMPVKYPQFFTGLLAPW